MYAKVSTVLGRNRIFTHHYIFVLLELAHKHFICDNFFLPKQSVEEHMTKVYEEKKFTKYVLFSMNHSSQKMWNSSH